MLAGIVVAVSPTVALAQQRDVPQLAVGRLTGDARPTIDGIVDEGIWSTSVPHSTFTQQEPNEGQPATERTDVWFLLDSTNLYIAVVCHDSQPDRLVVTQSRRDANLTNTDSIQILLDTFNDGQNGVRLRHQPVRHRVRRPSDGRGPDRRTRRRGRGIAARAATRIQHELGRRLHRPRPAHRARMGGRVRDPAQDPALCPGRGPRLGGQRHADYPAEE